MAETEQPAVTRVCSDCTVAPAPEPELCLCFADLAPHWHLRCPCCERTWLGFRFPIDGKVVAERAVAYQQHLGAKSYQKGS